MQDTGMIRRIDELGRIVIPKEIRSTLHLKVGSPLNIKVENECLVLSLHNEMTTISKIANGICDAMFSGLNIPTIITDNYSIIATSGCKKMYINKQLSKGVLDIIECGKSYIYNKSDKTTMIPLFVGDDSEYFGQIIWPIISDNKTIGVIACISFDNEINTCEIDALKVASKYIIGELN